MTNPPAHRTARNTAPRDRRATARSRIVPIELLRRQALLEGRALGRGGGPRPPVTGLQPSAAWAGTLSILRALAAVLVALGRVVWAATTADWDPFGAARATDKRSHR